MFFQWLDKREAFWRDHQQWLKEMGYLLRPRYDPKWVPSWLVGVKGYKYQSEDSLMLSDGRLLDAIQISDGQQVMLKKVYVEDYPDEAAIGLLLSSKNLSSNPRNHCIPIYNVLEIPDTSEYVIVVMPFLMPFYEPPFTVIGEIVEFFRQIFEGLQFMHHQNIAHCDIKVNNILSDTLHLYSSRGRPHPRTPDRNRTYTGKPEVISTRSKSEIKHYLMDFGLSRHYPEGHPHLHLPNFGGTQMVPEFRDHPSSLCDPFAVDVFCMGDMIRTQFRATHFELMTGLWFPGYRGLEFMDDLLADMVKDDPKERPTMDEVVERFERIICSLSEHTLLSRAATVDESPMTSIFKSARHWISGVV